jgi:hypothetical protein
MDVLANIKWFLLTDPSTAVYKDTYQQITKKDLEQRVF